MKLLLFLIILLFVNTSKPKANTDKSKYFNYTSEMNWSGVGGGGSRAEWCVRQENKWNKKIEWSLLKNLEKKSKSA